MTDVTPAQIAQVQAYDAREFMERVRAGGGLKLPWPDLDRMVGPMLPGWLVVIGGRAKAGKTTMLMALLTAWVKARKRVVYVGTETGVEMLRYLWAAMRCEVPLDWAVDPHLAPETYERIMRDVETAQTDPQIADFAIFADAKDATVSELALWANYGKTHQADALIFDHFSRLEVGVGERWQGLGQAIRSIKKMAVEVNQTIVVGAQLTQGEGGSVLGEHEVPGNGSWAGSSEIQREADVALQLWRPFQPGVTAKQKQAAREDMEKIRDIVQTNVMGVRLAAHRWGRDPNQFARLAVNRGQITDFSGRIP